MNLPPQLENLHKIKYNMPIGAMLALLINIALILLMLNLEGNQAGYYVLLLLVIGTTFLVFYLFGIRELKWMIAFGLIIFLILGAVSTYLYVGYIYTEGEPLYSEDGVLTNGTVQPFAGAPSDTYVFSIEYNGDQPINDTEIRVFFFKRLYSTENWTLELVSDDGSYFHASTSGNSTLDEEIHSYYFVLKQGDRWDYLSNETDDIYTNEAWGPLTKAKGSVVTALLPMGMVIQGICNLGMLFFIVALLYWWMGKAKQQRREWESAQEEALKPKQPEPFKARGPGAGKKKKPADFTCTSCGGDAWEDDEKCQHCGEPFDDGTEGADEEDTAAGKPDRPADFSCTECGGDVWDEDRTCRSCGEPFDDDDAGDEDNNTSSGARQPSERASDDKQPSDNGPDDGQFRFCPHCGKDLIKKFTFCPHCGKPLYGLDDDE